jgi:hypothetical protein
LGLSWLLLWLLGWLLLKLDSWLKLGSWLWLLLDVLLVLRHVCNWWGSINDMVVFIWLLIPDVTKTLKILFLQFVPPAT